MSEVAWDNHRRIERARQAAARRKAKPPTPALEPTEGCHFDGDRALIPSGAGIGVPIPQVLSTVSVRISPSCDRGRWVVQRAASALLGGNVILWKRSAIKSCGAHPLGGDRFEVAVPRGLRPTLHGVVLISTGNGPRTAYRVEFGDVTTEPVAEPTPDDRRLVEFAWQVTAPAVMDYMHDLPGRDEASRVSPYKAARAIEDARTGTTKEQS